MSCCRHICLRVQIAADGLPDFDVLSNMEISWLMKLNSDYSGAVVS